MSLFSTIAHEGIPSSRRITVRGIGMAVVTLVLGAVIGFVVSENRTTTDQVSQPATATAGLAHGEFLRLNTTDLEYLTPMVPALPSTPVAGKVDPFQYVNVGSFDGLIGVYEERHLVDPAFADMNVSSYENLTPMVPGLASFIDANVGSYDGLSRIWEENHAVAPGFVDINVTPTSEWTQQPSGPR